jgi:ABC-2 type transport system ATP-binding protein
MSSNVSNSNSNEKDPNQESIGSAGYAIELIDISKQYKSFLALDKISFTVKYGSIFGLIGPNGAGKTTLIKILTTLLSMNCGLAKIAGYNVSNQAMEVREHIGYVPQLVSADGNLTGSENLWLSARIYNVPFKERKARIAEALEFFNLSSWANDLVSNYSGGMIRKLELAQAMLHRPTVLFLDEPSIGLDVRTCQSVWERLKEMVRIFNVTILITTHDMTEADKLCDEIALLHQGHLMITGTPSELKKSVGENASLIDVFTHYTGEEMEEGGRLGDVRDTRNTIHRLR